jgi:ubiquinone/menaquinone biosynthesis C-methylase UbiE
MKFQGETGPESRSPRIPDDNAHSRQMAAAYTDDYLRIFDIEHYHLGYFEPDIAPDDLPTALERHLEVLLSPLKLGPDSTVLELGCNVGATASWLVHRYGCTVYAIDIVENMVRIADKRFEREKIKGRAIASCMDARHLDFKDEMFDAIVGVEVLHHFDEKLGCLRDLARVLKPGGQLALAEYLLEPGAPKLGARLVRMIVESEGLHDEQRYRSDLAAAGFGSPVISDHYKETVVGTNGAFVSDRYRAKSTAYVRLYFGTWFSLAFPWLMRAWTYMFERGHARYVFLHSRKPLA